MGALFSEIAFWTVTAAIICGAVFDLLFGDPSWLGHPVIWIGRMISSMEKGLRKTFSKSPMGQFMAGLYLVVLILFDTAAVFGGVCVLGFFLHPALGFIFETLWCAQSLALRGLMQAGEKVKRALCNQGEDVPEPDSLDAQNQCIEEKINDDYRKDEGTDRLSAARAAVAEIVGRDTENLDETAIIKATVETIAENASDGVGAPLFYMLLGGAPAAMLYKAVNTMDSMIGYKNKRYFYYGKAAARLDDLANLIPSRLTAICMLLAAAIMPGYDGKRALRVFFRDRYSQESPNATQTESVMAGALGISLLGDAYYFGELVPKASIGEAVREPQIADIDRANRLIFAASVIFFIVGIMLRVGVYLLIMR